MAGMRLPRLVLIHNFGIWNERACYSTAPGVNSGDSTSIIPLFRLLPGFRGAKSFVKAGSNLSS